MRELIKKSAKKVLWHLLPKPWLTADMEFHYGLWNGVSAMYSDGGRQLGEENTRPLIFNHHIPAETIECKYKDSRNGRPINMSALRIAMLNFEAATKITEAVRRYHLCKIGDQRPIGLWDLNIIARASIALLAYQKRAIHFKPASRTVSNALTSQYQFISGVFMICRHMMEQADPRITHNQPISSEALYAYANKHNLFISFNGMACAGSIKKIHEFLNICNTGQTETCDLSQIVGKPDNWFQYALAAIELDCFVEQHRLHQSNPAAAQIQGNMGHFASQMMDPLYTGDYALPFKQSVLARQNNILRILGKKTIENIPASHFSARINKHH